MCSKWIKKDLFDQFVEEKQQEETTKKSAPRRSETVWQTPSMGTQDKAKVYEIRFLPDPKGKFYKRFYYHGFKSGDRWYFPLCEKTYDFYNWCPFCAAASKLYTGTAADKQQASVIKRKEKFVGNAFIVDDPRDAEREDKVVGTVKLYEFPSEVESKLKGTITDMKHGLGPAVFDPGDEGYNFIIKVKATKPTREGKQWPVYADSEFARKPSALAKTDREIQNILNQTFDIDEYIASQKMLDEDVIALLKNEMLWESVKEEWSRYKGKVANGDVRKEVREEPKDSPFGAVKNSGTVVTSKKNVEEDVGEYEEPPDQDLLKELDEL
ncbi:MAG TPA: hypothetical protein P5293_05860 [Bacteroidales bacterium]|nr:hypothetical protein [Bacteroidales bacterium]